MLYRIIVNLIVLKPVLSAEDAIWWASRIAEMNPDDSVEIIRAVG